MFALCWHYRVVNVVVLLIPQANENVHIYTYYPFTENNCRKLTIKLLSVYKGGRAERIQFFPKKMENFFRCPLRVAARNYPPFFMRKGSKRSYYKGPISGIEGLILMHLSEHLNFTIDLLPETAEQASVYSNFTTTGILGQIDDGQADVAVGGLSLFTPELGIKYSTSNTYYQSSIVLVVRRGIQFGPIEQLLKPFDNFTWFLNFLLYLSGTLAILIISRSKGWMRGHLMGRVSYAQFQTNFFAMTIGYTIKTVPRGIVVRIILTYWLLYSYFMRTAYQGAMFDSIRKNCETRFPKTIEGLIKDKYEIITTSDKCSIPYSIIFNRTKAVDVGYEEIFSVVQNSTAKVAALVLFDQLSYINYKSRNNSGGGTNLTFIPERLSYTHMLIFYPKHSFLRQLFNIELRKFRENGMIAAHTKHYANKKYNKYDVNSGMKSVITGDRLLGIFSIFLGILAFATLVFAGEILADKFGLLSKFFDFLNYSICPEEQRMENYKNYGPCH